MVASMEKALAKSIARYHDRIRGADCLVVRPLAYDRDADLVPQETVLQQLLLRPINGAALAEIVEHANLDGV